MRMEDIKKVMIFDQGFEDNRHPAFLQLMTKAKDIFCRHCNQSVEFLRVVCEDRQNPEKSSDEPQIVATAIEAAVRKHQPDLLLIAATSLGEEVAPALGVRLGTGVAAHCVDIKESREGRVVYMVPAFGGKLIGEIFIPQTKPAIATVKPGIFEGDAVSAGEYQTLSPNLTEAEQSLGILGGQRLGFDLVAREEKHLRRTSIEQAKLIFCGGFGIGSKDTWQKLESLAERMSGGAGCTRPVVDMDWGADEYSMIGTSGRSVRPKVYVGFGISGAAHHICGIKDADIIISINNDKEAEVFASSDYKAVIDARAVIDSLLQKIGG